MNKSKKGVTLVELIICCVVMVLLGGACTAVLVSGQKLFNSGSYTANAQLEANVVQTSFINSLPSMTKVEKKTLTGAKTVTDGVSVFFDGAVFTIRVNGNDINVNEVKSFTFTLDKAGKADSANAKTQFKYTVVIKDGTATGSTVSGGLVLSNITYDAAMEVMESIDWTVEGIYFSMPDESSI